MNASERQRVLQLYLLREKLMIPSSDTFFGPDCCSFDKMKVLLQLSRLLMRKTLIGMAAIVFLTCAMAIADADVTRLHEQLALATKDDATPSRIELLRRILDIEPSDVASRRLLVELLLKVNDYDLAEATLKAWPDAPPGVTAVTRAAVQRYRDQDLNGAIRTLRDYLATTPQDNDAHEALVSALLVTNDLAAQLAALDAFVSVQRDASNLMRRAKVKSQLGDYRGAIEDAKAAAALEPQSEIVKSNLPSFQRLEEVIQVLPHLDAAVTKDPHALDSLLERAWWFHYTGIYTRSLADAAAALNESPDSIAAKITHAKARWHLGQLTPDRALKDELINVTRPLALEAMRKIADADVALKQKPNNATFLLQRAQALNGAEQYLLALRDAKTALAIDEHSVDAALEALSATSQLHQDPTPIFRQIEAMNPPKTQLALASAQIADYYFQTHKLPLALDFANRSIAVSETVSALRVKAAILQRLGRYNEALKVNRRADSLSR